MLGFYTREDIPDYHRLTDEYVLFDRFLQAMSGGSTCNALYRVPPEAQTYPNIGERLNAAGLSWAWYNEGWEVVKPWTLKRALGRDSGSAVVDTNTLHVPHHNAFPYCPS